MTNHVTINDTRRVVVRNPENAPQSTEEFKRFGGNRSAKKDFKPQTIELEWKRSGAEDWQLDLVKVSGPVIKKDGELGLVTHSAEYVVWGTVEQPIPDWLKHRVEVYRPLRTP